ncbi:MAG: CinA family nicotinamide mononucleotide deamidase-related protein, partial [Crocinitomicaceae bacterium]|nr:CinA family nicotinamide mononucleotide deamidase-related protein [Crocinitomicaceae bacterium]
MHLSIGDELLIGQTINTNASWLGQQLSAIGARIIKTVSIADTVDAIVNALDATEKDTNCVIITGGLGPTKDDITKHTLCSYFNTTLEIHQPTLDKIEDYFSKRNRPMLETNRQQAALPLNCTILNNSYGTAAGMWFDEKGKVFISLPGVPYEMKGIMTEEGFPRLKEKFSLKSIYHRTALTQGIGESFLAEIIKDWENSIREKGLGLAYLPSPGLVKLRITSYKGAEDADVIDEYFEQLAKLIPEALFGYENDTLPSVIGNLLKEKNLSIGTVESCTTGLLASQITSISGASDYFQGSLLTYSNELKMKIAQVSSENLENFGAVSEQVAIEMAEGGRKNLGVDICISTTGIAGPTGGTEEKPVGLVWIGIALPNKTIARKFIFGDNRERN